MDESEKLYRRYSKYTPGGVQSNFRYESPYPIYYSRAKGSRVWDVDGKEYLDYLIGFGSIILGHNDPRVSKAVVDSLESGITSGLETELNFRLVETLCKMIPSAEMARLCNSGTEAVMHALMIARGYTGKDKIVKAEGTYHGWYGPVLMSYHPDIRDAGPAKNPIPVPGSKGLEKRAGESTIVIPYNDAASARRIIKEHKDELAAVLIEPVCFNTGALLPKKGYLEELREITSSLGIPLIFDEVITGFRLAPGGAQELFGVTPDLSVFGKAMANGFPISAITGRADIMNVSRPGGTVGYGGTYNASQIPVAASYATLKVLKDGSVQKYLRRCTEYLQKGVAEVSKDSKVDVTFQGVGGKFQLFFTSKAVTDYREAASTNQRMYGVMREKMKQAGILFQPSALFHHGVTNSHTKADLQRFTTKLAEILASPG